jgi:hypothetical protein
MDTSLPAARNYFSSLFSILKLKRMLNGKKVEEKAKPVSYKKPRRASK